MDTIISGMIAIGALALVVRAYQVGLRHGRIFGWASVHLAGVRGAASGSAVEGASASEGKSV